MSDMKNSQKLSYLLRLLWNNPIFGDSYPPVVYESSTLLQIKTIHADFVTKFRKILAEGMPHASLLELDETMNQIAPKSVAFCAAIAAGEIQDTDRLCNAAVAIAISYWADQTMDRGDEAMLAAVRHINNEIQKGEPCTQPVSRQISSYLSALRQIKRLAGEINDHPEDLPYMLRAICVDVLSNQAHVRDLSRQYLITGDVSKYWDNHTEEIVRTVIANSGLMSAVTAIYIIYRYYQPDIPSLADIYQHPELSRLIAGPFNGAVRIFDDLGDRQIDLGQNPQWGIFNINLFNQPNAELLEGFIRSSGIEDAAQRDALMESFMRADAPGRMRVTKTYIHLLREKFESLPEGLLQKYAVFLDLCKRTLEAGLVNSLGDILLTEDKGFLMGESEILELVTPGISADFSAKPAAGNQGTGDS